MIGTARFNIKSIPFYSQSVFMYNVIITVSGVQWPSWLRHCATPESQGFVSRWGHPDRSVVLGSTRPVKEMSTRDISWGGG